MYDCKAPLSRFYYPDTRRIINAFIIIALSNLAIQVWRSYLRKYINVRERNSTKFIPGLRDPRYEERQKE